jgi:DNA-binding IclR family transcriptional regulator
MDDQTTGKERPLDRYISVLERVAEFNDGLSALEVERLLHLPKTTVNRLLKTLVEAELLENGPNKARSYVLGGRLLRLLHTSPSDGWIERVAQKPLQKLAEGSGETAFLVKLSGHEIRSVSTEAPDTPVRTYVVPGRVMPPHASATAKAILAWQPEAVLEAMMGQPMERLTTNTNVNRTALRKELEDVRSLGYAVERGEHVVGLASIGSPVLTPQIGVIYAVGLTGPFDRITGDAFASHVEALQETAELLAKTIMRNR